MPPIGGDPLGAPADWPPSQNARRPIAPFGFIDSFARGRAILKSDLGGARWRRLPRGAPQRAPLQKRSGPFGNRRGASRPPSGAGRLGLAADWGRSSRRARRLASLSERAPPDRPLWVYRLIRARQSYFEKRFGRRPLAAAPAGRPPKGTLAKAQRPVWKLARRLAAAQWNGSAWTCRRLGAILSARPPMGRPFKTRAARSPPFGFIDSFARGRAILNRYLGGARWRRFLWGAPQRAPLRKRSGPFGNRRGALRPPSGAGRLGLAADWGRPFRRARRWVALSKRAPPDRPL